MFLPKDNAIHSAPVDEASVAACRKVSCGTKKATMHLNRTLPSLLDEGCELAFSASAGSALSFVSRLLTRAKSHKTVQSDKIAKPRKITATINHYYKGQWQRWTLAELRQAAEEIALGLCQHAALETGDRAALLMESDVSFVMADIGCLLAGLVSVPISPEQPPETTEYMLNETSASVLFVSGIDRVKQLSTQLAHLSGLKLIVVASASRALLEHPVENKEHTDSTGYDALENSLRELRCAFPETIELVTMTALRQQVQWSAAKVKLLKAATRPDDLATIVYTLSDSGKPLGAMLTHENLSGSVLAAFSTLPCLRKGADEVALSFLPLHHIFARGFVYGSLSYGQSLYFSSPRRVMKHLRQLKPTVFFTVPRLLEKVYEGWENATFSESATPSARLRWLSLSKVAMKQHLLAWAWRLASRYRLEDPQSWLYRVQLWAARQTVFRPLRNLFGGRLQCFISGGAALPASVMTLLSAAGLKLCQGYGLTEASSTLCFTRRQWRRTGTVGVPMPGVEIALSEEGEVMVKAPYVMQGYYQNPEATAAVLEENGWLHTGDRGEFGPDGLLTLTGQKKGLFKLSIGEYVAPQPIEQRILSSPLVQDALVVGPGRKFCGLLIVPNMAALILRSQQAGLATPPDLLIKQPQIISMYQALVDQANAGLPFWSTVKRFLLVEAGAVEAGADRNDRDLRYSALAQEIEQLYAASAHTRPARQRPARKYPARKYLEGVAPVEEAPLETSPLTQATSVS